MIAGRHEQVVLYDIALNKAIRQGNTLTLFIDARKGVVEGDIEKPVSFREPLDVGLWRQDRLLQVRSLWVESGENVYTLEDVPEDVDRVQVDPFYLRVNRRWRETEAKISNKGG